MVRLLVCFAFLSVVSTPVRPQNGNGPGTATLSELQWQQDLDFFATHVQAGHASPFHFIPKQAFEKEVAGLRAQLGKLGRDEIFTRMDQIANSVGDGHTYIRVPGESVTFPVEFEAFGGQFYLVSAANVPGAQAAVGARLVRVGSTPMEKALPLLMTLTPADEHRSLREVRAADLLRQGMVLHGLGIARQDDSVSYALVNDAGKAMKLTLTAGSSAADAAGPRLNVLSDPPLWQSRPQDGFWCEMLPRRTGYCAFRSYKDLEKTSQSLRDLLAREHPSRMIVDLRLNKGGNFSLGEAFVLKPLQENPAINRKGHLFVLIGAKTFSAAMSNAAQFRDRTAAWLVGQPVGEKPNSYQEADEATLPNSHWVMRYSTRFYRFTKSKENTLRPDTFIPETWADYRDGRDPVLDWILRRQETSSSAGR